MRHSIIALALLALVCGLGVASSAATVTITFNPAAHVQVQPGCDVLLRDVAAIDAPKEMATAIGKIEVGHAPLAGQSWKLDIAAIEKRVRLAAPKATVAVMMDLNNKPAGLHKTGRALDMAIKGEGFFQVLLPTGETAYTRNGAFKLDRDGQVVTSDGYPLQPAITLPVGAEKLSISMVGAVTVSLNGAEIELGSIELVRFMNPDSLISVDGDDSIFVKTDKTSEPMVGAPGSDGFGGVINRFLDTSDPKSEKVL